MLLSIDFCLCPTVIHVVADVATARGVAGDIHWEWPHVLKPFNLVRDQQRPGYELIDEKARVCEGQEDNSGRNKASHG